MSNQIPGVPEGWEVDHVNRIGEVGEHCIDGLGMPYLLRTRTLYHVCIIRKVVKPDEYRPFENAAEYLPHFDRPLITMDRPGAVRVVECNDNGVWIGPGSAMLTYAQVLSDGFRFGDNGTPFGVKVES